MFTIEQIKAAHSKVKSGADFPAYIQDLKQLGIHSYEIFVMDSHSDYLGNNGYKTSSVGEYAALSISDSCNPEQFKADLKTHQLGKTDYLTFCNDSAKSGVEKWKVSIDQMTCTYFDKAGNIVLTEQIPG